MIRMVAFLAGENQKFVLYEYMLFFWKKKVWFLLIPLVTAVISLLIGQLFLHKPAYTGKAVVFTGAVNIKDLTNPENIRAKLPNIKNELDIVVTEDKYVKITVEGDNKTSVQKELHKVISKYNDQLQQHSQQRLEITELYLQSLEERIDVLQKAIKRYNEKLDSQTITPQQLESTTDLLIEAENNLTEVMERAHRIRSNLVFYEKPAVLSETVFKSKTYLGQTIAIGIILGVFLTFIVLILMKYVLDARRYYQHD
jgi:hypothetical protein